MESYLRVKSMTGLNFGHVLLEKNGKQCSCGNRGCIETYISMKVLKEAFARKKNVKHISGLELYDTIKNNNGEFDDILSEFILNLKLALTTYINIFEPEAICIGGSFAYYEDLLLKKLISSMKDDNLTFNKSMPSIVTAKMRKLCRNNWFNYITEIIHFNYILVTLLKKVEF